MHGWFITKTIYHSFQVTTTKTEQSEQVALVNERKEDK